MIGRAAADASPDGAAEVATDGPADGGVEGDAVTAERDDSGAGVQAAVIASTTTRIRRTIGLRF
jgi:hypothetical protein